MKIGFLVLDLDGPSTRYRVLQYLPYFKKKGWETQIHVLPKRMVERIRLFPILVHVDVVFLQKRLLNFWNYYLLRKYAKQLVFDFDDAIMFRDSLKGEFNSFFRRKRFIRSVKHSDLVIAGNCYLQRQAMDYNDHVCVIPTPIDMERYSPKTYTQNPAIVTLGWIGSRSTLFYLEKIKHVLESVFERYPNVRLKIVSDRFFEGNRIPIIEKVWKYEEEIEDLHSFDIGLMPLTDDPWSKGKCGFKLLQYMAVGVPAICSPVGVNQEIVKHGVNGFLADSDEQWIESLSLLIEDSLLREKMGKEAIKTVEKDFALEVWASRLLTILNNLIKRDKER